MLGVVGLLAAASPAVGGANYYENSIYAGTGAEAVITNGVNSFGSGGLVWVKNRTTATSHKLTDSERGVTKSLCTDTTDAEATEAQGLTAFGTRTFTIGTDADYNNAGENYVAWSFKQKTGFFDVVKYTGNGSARDISHSLGATPGMIIVKKYGGAGTDWYVYHRSNTAAPETDYLLLNTTAATADLNTVWNDTAPSSTVFTLGTNAGVNNNTDTYVAYLFGHDAAGMVQCGGYTGNGAVAGPTVTLGWRPAFIMIKNTGSTYGWVMLDAARSPSNPVQKVLYANVNSAEVTQTCINISDTGFQVVNSVSPINENAKAFVYLAIRA